MRHSRRTWPATLPIPPFAGLLLVANAAIFVVAGSASGSGYGALALVPAELAARPWSAVTYAFLHGNVWHLLLDLAALALIAPRLESGAGGRVLVGWYLAGALAAVPLGFLAPETGFAGSGAAVLGVLIGFARRLPDERVVPRLPGKNRWVVPLLVGAPLIPLVAAEGAAVAVAHLGLVLVVGAVVTRPERRPVARRVEEPNSHYNAPGVPAAPPGTPWDGIDLDALHEVNREAVVGVLERAKLLGPSHLTPSEREFLDRMCAASRLNRGLMAEQPPAAGRRLPNA